MKTILRFISDTINYVCDIRLIELPYNLFKFAAMVGIAYCAQMILIGFPVTVYEHFAKKEVNQDLQAKISKWATVLIFLFFLYVLWREEQ